MNGSSKGWINHERRKEVKNREREEEKGKRKEHRNSDRDFQGERGEAEKGAVCITKRKKITQNPAPFLF